MYLQERMEGSDGKIYDMAGALFGKSYKTEKLRRFGYIILSKGTVFGHNVGNITAHEFHYYESECIYSEKTDVHEGMGVYDQYRYNIGRISTYSLYGKSTSCRSICGCVQKI